MPYFNNDELNLLFIHIPKAGGSSVEIYISNKYSIKLDTSTLYGFFSDDFKKQNDITKIHSLQHYTYNELYDMREILNIDFTDDLKLFTIVRNPYYRLLSDLFFLGLVKHDTDKTEVPRIIRRYIVSNKDNHAIPQFRYIVDKDGYLLPNIKILKTETLNSNMVKLGFRDFNTHECKNRSGVSDIYDDFLTPDVIKLVNFFYEEDFKYFDYDKIQL